MKSRQKPYNMPKRNKPKGVLEDEWKKKPVKAPRQAPKPRRK